MEYNLSNQCPYNVHMVANDSKMEDIQTILQYTHKVCYHKLSPGHWTVTVGALWTESTSEDIFEPMITWTQDNATCVYTHYVKFGTT